MASSINASTTSGIIQTADNSGILQLQSGGTTIATISSTGLQQNVGAPAFSAYPSSSQTLTNIVLTKILNNTKVFDTNNNFDAATNYRFTPTVAGYYQVTAAIRDNTGATNGFLASYIYKNGYQYTSMAAPNSGQGLSSIVTSLVYLNGSTDYIEHYAIQNSGSNMSVGGPVQNYFQASMIRSA